MSLTIGGRLKLMRAELRLTQKVMADEMGLSPRGWQAVEADENVPSGDTLLKVSRMGYSPTWILTGEGQKLMTDDGDLSSPIDAAVLQQATELVERVHNNSGITLRKSDLTKKAIETYNDLVGLAPDLRNDDAVRLAFRLVENDLQTAVNKAVTEPGSGKREAS